MRKSRKLDVKKIAEALAFTRNYWSAVENDRTLIAADKLERVLDLMNASPTERAELTALREAARERGWWDDPDLTIDDATRQLCGLEAGATSIRAYESNVFPGLFQIEEYTRAVLAPDPGFSHLQVENVLSVRRRRQERLTGPDPLDFTVILSEACLLQQVDGPEVQIAQLKHIVNLIEQHDNIEVRIALFGDNPGAAANASTLLFLHFNAAHLPDVAWQESIGPFDILSAGTHQYTRLEASFDDALRRALSKSDSAEAVREAISKLAR